MCADDWKRYEQPELKNLGKKDDELSEKDLQKVTGGGLAAPPVTCHTGNNPDQGECVDGGSLANYPGPL